MHDLRPDERARAAAILASPALVVRVVERPVLARRAYDHRFLVIQGPDGYLYLELVAAHLLWPFRHGVRVRCEVHVRGEDGDPGTYALTPWHEARAYRMSEDLRPADGRTPAAFGRRVFRLAELFMTLAPRRLRYTRGLFDGPGRVRAYAVGEILVLNSNHFVTAVLAATGGLAARAVTAAIPGSRARAPGARADEMDGGFWQTLGRHARDFDPAAFGEWPDRPPA